VIVWLRKRLAGIAGKSSARASNALTVAAMLSPLSGEAMSLSWILKNQR
jgi:hypothetical protein